MEQSTPVIETPRRTFTRGEIAAAWVLLLLGYGLWRVSPLKYYPFGAFLWTLTMLAVTVVYLYKTGTRLSVRQWAFPIFAAVLSVGYLVTDESALHAWTFVLTACAYLVWLLRVSGNGLQTASGELLPTEVCKAVIVVPFSRFAAVFSAWFQPRRADGKRGSVGLTLLWVLLGLCAAVMPVIVVVLLLGFDSNFSRIFERFSEIRIGSEVLERVFCLIGAVPVAMFLFGALLGNKERAAEQSMSREACGRFVSKLRVLPRALVAAFITPLLAVYAAFFFSQVPYFVSAFSGVLPAGMSYAVYARDGFFQLCAVCGINAVILAVVMTFCKRRDGFDAVRVVFVTLLSLSSVLLAVTALSKMALYIGSYGLTPNRVYASWLMLLLICCFLSVIVRMFVRRMNLNRVIVGLLALFFTVLALSNPSGAIAKYNVDAYLSGQHESIDMDAMYDLYDAAVPQVYRLWQETEKGGANVHAEADAFLDQMSRTEPAQSSRILSFSIPSVRADKALQAWSAER